MRLAAVLVVGALVTVCSGGPGAVHAQKTAGKVYRVGTLFPPVVYESFRIEEIRNALAAQGYDVSRNLVLESKVTDTERFYRPDLARELVRSGVDVIVTIEIAGGQAAREATANVPIVVLNCDPHQQLVATLARPGGNVTGQSCMNAELTAKKLEMFKAAVPSLTRVGFLYNPKQPGPVLGLKLAEDAATSLGIDVHPIAVGASEDVEPAFRRIAQERIDGLFVYHDFVTASHRAQIVAFATRSRLPAIYGYREWVDAGGLMSYGPNLRAMFARGGHQVARILGGASPAELPVEQPTTFEMALNLKAAAAIGMTIPLSILRRADVVIE